MYPKDELVGKYVEYRDTDGKFRIEKVVKVIGNKLTVMNGIKERHRIWEGKSSLKTGLKIHIFGRVTPKTKTYDAEPIEWGPERKRKRRSK